MSLIARWIVAGLVIAVPLPLRAQIGRGAAAQDAFQTGLEAYQAGDFEGAVRSLQLSRSMLPHAMTEYVLAAVYSRLADVSATHEHAMAALTYRPPLPDEYSREATRLLLWATQGRSVRSLRVVLGTADPSGRDLLAQVGMLELPSDFATLVNLGLLDQNEAVASWNAAAQGDPCLGLWGVSPEALIRCVEEQLELDEEFGPAEAPVVSVPERFRIRN